MSSASNNAMSICIPRAFENITEARVAKVFEALNIFEIGRIDMVKRVNEKGDKFQRIFVHIKKWFETADALKAKDRLLAGKELKIVYDDPWFWKVSLNTWTQKPKASVSVVYDRKPKIRIDFDEEDLNTAAATALLSDLTLKEDSRPYRERRVDPVYCEQDVKQGFRDRREPRDREPRDRDDRYQRPRDDQRDDQRPREYQKDQRPKDYKYNNNKNKRPQEHKVNAPVDYRDNRDGSGSILYPIKKDLVVVEKPVVDQNASLNKPAPVEPLLIRITPENVDQYIGEYIIFKQKNSDGEHVILKIKGVSETDKSYIITYPFYEGGISFHYNIVTRNVYLHNGANIVEKPVFKPRVIETKEQKDKKKRINALLSSHAISSQIINPSTFV